MTDRPIIFSAPMVRALLEGRKTMTRRLIKPQPPKWATFCQQPSMLNSSHAWVPSGLWRWSEPEASPPRPLRAWPVDAAGDHYWMRLAYQPGDRLWVREGWSHTGDGVWSIEQARRAVNGHPIYRANDDGTDPGIRWWPSIHMLREFSRLTLTVTGVKVERLQEITLGEICAEGLARSIYDFRPVQRGFDAWAELWDSLHGAGAWDANPWVVAISFTVEQRNIDAMPAAGIANG